MIEQNHSLVRVLASKATVKGKSLNIPEIALKIQRP